MDCRLTPSTTVPPRTAHHCASRGSRNVRLRRHPLQPPTPGLLSSSAAGDGAAAAPPIRAFLTACCLCPLCRLWAQAHPVQWPRAPGHHLALAFLDAAGELAGGRAARGDADDCVVPHHSLEPERGKGRGGDGGGVRRQGAGPKRTGSKLL